MAPAFGVRVDYVAPVASFVKHKLCVFPLHTGVYSYMPELVLLRTTYEPVRTHMIRRLCSLSAFISRLCLARQTRLLSSVFWLDVVGILSSTKTGNIGRYLGQIRSKLVRTLQQRFAYSIHSANHIRS